jgi:NADH:ubiquinone reductase (H+-translocating)
MAVESRPKVVIVGAGFGGLWAARTLAQAPMDIWVVDRNNYHTFFPLLYQVAAAELEPEDIIYPVRNILHNYSNIRFLLGEVTGIDWTHQKVLLGSQSIPYDYLILSVGSEAHFLSVSGAAEYAFPLKTLDDAVQLRNHILCRFEAANYETDSAIRKQMLTFAIVGGGPTGVEFAGALAELVRVPLHRDYPNLDFSEVHILLLEATERLLTGVPERLQNYTVRQLKRKGVEVQLNSPVSQITSQAVTLKDGRVIPTETVVWTAGVGGTSLLKNWDFPTRRNGQLDVLPTLQVADHPNIYIIGDLAHVEQEGHPLQLIATVATQEGKWAGKNVRRQISGVEPKPFRYHDPGMMAVTGRNAAVVRIGRYAFTGFPAWVIWLSVHLYRLIGFRNRLFVLVNWALDYIFFDRVVRLITPLPDSEPLKKGC